MFLCCRYDTFLNVRYSLYPVSLVNRYVYVYVIADKTFTNVYTGLKDFLYTA